ncbi:SpoIIE family protein phosphatase [Streptomyces griseiscabiei]|uniref:SpoIIE family protein phosphatase n=1 Tax=Streptomyces griseiscabiei TaxID=2993540 RepID=A0ABU4L3W0_9ACTN|nr:SpoIIE family protein phosphatase [Streptomyces griseiscabiei]MBZ3901157.1 SpoIIE family protein phosphatase [Streptomyces griseiscabiei]MDX2910293.1 SpoIIE family protein phosphatase [Streptomyces griseiscabiei]
MHGYATPDRDETLATPGGLLDLLHVASVVLDAEGRIALWSPAMEQLLGHPAREALGQRADHLLVTPENRPRARELFDQVSAGARWVGVFPLRHRDGGERAVEFRTMRLLDREGEPHLLGLAADAMTVRGVERDLALSHSLVNQTPVGIAVFDTALRWIGVNPALERINGVPESALVGRRIAEVLPDLDVEAIEARMRHVLETGRSLLDQHTVGHTAADSQSRTYSESYHRIEDTNGRVLGLAMAVLDITERQRAAAEVAEARRRLAVIADAGVRIGTTLDLEQTARELADVAVPQVADLAAVDVLESVVTLGSVPAVTGDLPAEFRALAVAVAHPSDAMHAADPIGELAAHRLSRVITQCVRSARPVLIERVDERSMRRIARDAPAAHALLAAGVHSYMALPLVARGSVLGTLSLYRTANERPFDDQDRLLASELAARAAISIDNARLYGRERATALTLQRSLLPATPARREGLDIAARYRPALSDVGGDWYDVLPLGPGRTGLVVGDVMGKGVQAAAIMGQLSSATRALARLDLEPAELLRHLDDIAGPLGDAIATCVYGVCDLNRGTCALSSAGHLPPVLATAEGDARLVEIPGGVPLGVGGVDFGTVEVDLAPGSLLALYTDGLVEKRAEPIDTGLAAFTRLLRSPAGTDLEHTGDALLNALRPRPDDDVALLLVRVRARSAPGGSTGAP